MYPNKTMPLLPTLLPVLTNLYQNNYEYELIILIIFVGKKQLELLLQL